MLGLILALILGFIAIIIPGFFLSLALLKKTGMNMIELLVMSVIFGMIAPATLTWLEAYLINYIHAFSFSLGLFLANCLLLTVIGIVICFWEGAFKDFKSEFLSTMPVFKNPMWIALLVLMLLTFVTRMLSIGIAPTFFEFDPYFTMVDTQYIVTYGQELLQDPAAWPAIVGGSDHRVEPIIPYLEAFWYDMATTVGGYGTSSFNTTLMSYIGSVYPPITAALLVFTVFLLLYKEYNEYIGIIGAGIAAAMPVIFTTFIAGEQLLEPWGIFALFFFLATYMLAVKNPKNTRLAILAGIAFASNFLGAHYYTVTVGVFVVYIMLQGLIDIIKRTSNTDFYKMNGIVILVIAIFYILFNAYGSTLENRIPSVLGVPIILAGPIIAILLVAFMDYVPKLLAKRNIVFKEPINDMMLYSWIALIAVAGVLVVVLTPLGAPVLQYVNLSAKFTTPSIPLFMTVEEYIPTGFFFDFGSQGFGPIGASIYLSTSSGTVALPVLVWLICAAGFAVVILSILYRNSRTGILYLAIAAPLAFAGFSEVKYLPHFGVALIILFCIMLGELCYYAENNFDIFRFSRKDQQKESTGELIPPQEKQYGQNAYAIALILSLGVFFFAGIFAILLLGYLAIHGKYKEHNTALWAVAVGYAVLIGLSFYGTQSLLFGESSSFIQSFGAAIQSATAANSTQLCNTLSDQNNSLGYTLYCNVIQGYWLNAMAWIKANVGPSGPRVLSWWDYGDWINWFGNSNAFIRGDNANALEDYAVAAQYVLDQNYGVSPQSLANFMNNNQSKYVLMDEDLISKWQALDFLACVNVNATSKTYAIAQGQAQNPPEPYLLGTSQCEITYDPQFALIPLPALVQNQSSLSQNINYYCANSNSTTLLVSTLLVVGSSAANQSVCVDVIPNNNGVLNVYSSNGVKMNAYIQSSQYIGVVNVQGVQFVEYMMIYVPNGPNDTITDAPTKFYVSNYYKGFILGNLPGFTQVYPDNGTGVNFVNGTYPIRIYALNNFTGTLPGVPQKPSWIQNNYTMP